MTEAQLTATKIPVNNLIDMLAAIGNRDYSRFQELEQVFVSQYGEEVWQEVFNFRVLPALVTDCTSFVVMLSEQITQAFTIARHFEQAGFVKLL